MVTVGAVVMPTRRDGPGGVTVASVNAEDALGTRGADARGGGFAYGVASTTPETGEILKFTSILHNARDGRTYEAVFGTREDADAAAADAKTPIKGGARTDASEDEDAEDDDEDEYGTDDEDDDAMWFAKVDENVPFERYDALQPTLSEDEDETAAADDDDARPSVDVGEPEGRMKPKRGESGVEHGEWERGVFWGADSDEDEEVRLAAAGIDAIGAFKKPRRDDDEGADARGTTDVVVPQSVSDAGARAKGRDRRDILERAFQRRSLGLHATPLAVRGGDQGGGETHRRERREDDRGDRGGFVLWRRSSHAKLRFSEWTMVGRHRVGRETRGHRSASQVHPSQGDGEPERSKLGVAVQGRFRGDRVEMGQRDDGAELGSRSRRGFRRRVEH